jgi:hypothetical protein
MVRGGFDYPLRNAQRHSVSNAEKFVRSATNFSGQKVLRFHEIWTSESDSDQEIWA